jgi:hypothetical protein
MLRASNIAPSKPASAPATALVPTKRKASEAKKEDENDVLEIDPEDEEDNRKEA